MVGGWLDLAPKDAVADHHVEQHKGEDEDALAPKHESEAEARRRGFLDRDRERDHARPERDGQSAQRRRENQPSCRMELRPGDCERAPPPRMPR